MQGWSISEAAVQALRKAQRAKRTMFLAGAVVIAKAVVLVAALATGRGSILRA